MILTSIDFKKYVWLHVNKNWDHQFGQLEDSEAPIQLRLIWKKMMTSSLQDCVILVKRFISFSKKAMYVDHILAAGLATDNN